MSGDGGFAMLMGDLLTLRQQELPVKIIVFKNDSLAFVELEMKAAGILEFGTDLHNPDFAKIAEGAGLLGLRAETADQVEPCLPKLSDTMARRWWKFRYPGRNCPCRRRSLSNRRKVSACS